jgi:glycosyltransferase involved in cell wall biosynthesis
MKLACTLAPNYYWEKVFYQLLLVWSAWVRSRPWPRPDIVQAVLGFGTEAFDRADESGALKVADCPTSHPVFLSGFWQRECDIWCPGDQPTVSRTMFARMNRELERADVILCPSHFVRDSMRLNGIPVAKCAVNPFGVNTTVFRPRLAVPSAPRFICVAPMRLLKGQQYLFPAFQLVKRQLPQAELICVGRHLRDFRHLRPQWAGTYTHIERLAHAQLAQLLPTCTAFVLPSVQEGLARVIPEAMAAGLPIIASYESGATTLVDDGVEGFIVRPRDPEHIAAAMLRIATDPTLGRQMGEAAYRRGAAGNDWQQYGDRLLIEYSARRSK